MDILSSKLNSLFVDTFRSVLKVEQASLLKMGITDISVSELHLLEAISKRKICTISDISNDIAITLSSVTIAINKLLQKKYVEKKKCENDGRVVYVSLTRLGEKMNNAHRYFHQQMILNAVSDMTDEEKNVLIKAVDKINTFFESKLSEAREL